MSLTKKQLSAVAYELEEHKQLVTTAVIQMDGKPGMEDDVIALTHLKDVFEDMKNDYEKRAQKSDE